MCKLLIFECIFIFDKIDFVTLIVQEQYKNAAFPNRVSDKIINLLLTIKQLFQEKEMASF